MAISSIRVENFRSFDSLELQLGPFNVIVGANAAGKSNFLQLLKFIADMALYGLDNAVAIQGGVKYLRNIGCDQNRPFVLEMTSTPGGGSLFLPISRTSSKSKKRGPTRFQDFTEFKLSGVRRKLVLNLHPDESYSIQEDHLSVDLEECKNEHARGTLELRNDRSQLSSSLVFDKNLQIDALYHEMIKHIRPKLVSFSSNALQQLPFPATREDELDLGIAYYDFDPRLSKQPVRVTGLSRLEETGNNLAIVVKSVLADPKRAKLLSDRLSDLLPFVSGIDVGFYTDRSVLMKLREHYHSGFDFPATFISDGSVAVISILIALLFEGESVVAIEEPERNIHPHLIAKIVGVMHEASERKQVFVSTHSPTMLDCVGIENVLLVTRDTDGYSRISRPKDSGAVQAFINNELGVGALFESGLLEAK